MRSYKQFILLILLSMSYLTANGQQCEQLIWSDEFNDSTLNPTFWNYDIGNGCPDLCGWGNNEEQYYTDSKKNVDVQDGKLIITALEESIKEMNFTSGKITTKNKIDFSYGRIECRAKLPQSQGLWPAFWMLPTDNIYGSWPRSGEIDIFELVGHEPGKVLGTIHTGFPYQFISKNYYLPDSLSFADDFHTFALLWGPDTVQWFVDDQMYHQVTRDLLSPWDPFSEDFHLILNVAVGGNLPGFTNENTILPQRMEVDYVRVYSQISDLKIQGNQPVSGQDSMRYNVFSIENAQYEWVVPLEATILEGQGTSEILIDWGCTPGDIELSILTECDSTNLIYVVDTFSRFQIQGPEEIEPGQSGIKFSTPSEVDVIYTWSVPEDATIISGQGSSEIEVDWGCLAGNVSVSAVTSCNDISADLDISFIEHNISGFTFVQENRTNLVYSITEIPNVTYTWSVPQGVEIIEGSNTSRITVNWGQESGTVFVELSGDCETRIVTLNIMISSSEIYCDFDGKDLEFRQFSGSTFEKIKNPFKSGIDTSEHIGQSRKDPGSQEWAGIFADLGGELDFNQNPFMHMKVYSTKTGIVKFKVEDLTSGEPPWELDINLETQNEWIDLVYDFTGFPAETFDRITLFFDFGSTDTSYWYFDDIIGSSTPVLNTKNIEILDLEVFPNPTSGKILILTNNFKSRDLAKVEIINAIGQSVIQLKERNIYESISLDISDLPKGSYFVKIQQNRLIYIKQIVLN